MDKIIQVDRTKKPMWTPAKLKVVWNTGTRGFLLNSMGTDHFPVERARKIGFVVKSLPDYCSREVAEHGFKLLQSLAIKVRYDRPLYSSSCLVIGSEGNIGQQVQRVAEFKGMDILNHDIVLGHTDKELKKKLRKAKIIFLCIPLNEKTKGFYDVKKIKDSLRIKPFVINVSGREDLVDRLAVNRALNTGKLEGYAIDEDLSDRSFRFHDKVFWTPHVGWESKESVKLRKKLLVEVRESLEKALVFQQPLGAQGC